MFSLNFLKLIINLNLSMFRTCACLMQSVLTFGSIKLKLKSSTLKQTSKISHCNDRSIIRFWEFLSELKKIHQLYKCQSCLLNTYPVCLVIPLSRRLIKHSRLKHTGYFLLHRPKTIHGHRYLSFRINLVTSTCTLCTCTLILSIVILFYSKSQ